MYYEQVRFFMVKMLVVGENKQLNKLWEENLRGFLGELYESSGIRYIESRMDSPISMSFTTETINGVHEARGDPKQLKKRALIIQN